MSQRRKRRAAALAQGRAFKAGRIAGQFIAAPYIRPRKGRMAFQELKFHDLDIDDQVVAAVPSIAQDSCNKIAQGVTESQRVGRKCVIKNIGWKFQITFPSTSTPGSTADTVRVILYLDKQCNGAIATGLGILETADYQSFNNLANKSRFRTLMDRTYDIHAPSGAWDGTNDQFGENIISDSFYKKCGIPIEFDNTTGAITEIRSNNIGVLLTSRDGFAGFKSKMRLRFSDG